VRVIIAGGGTGGLATALAECCLASGLGAEVVLVHVIAPGADYTDPARFVAEVRQQTVVDVFPEGI